MDSLCESPFWDWNTSWYTNDPDLTSCFHLTVLIWIPCCFLWVTASYEVYCALGSGAKNIPWNLLNLLKFGIITTLIISQLMAIVYLQFYSELKAGSIEWYSTLIKLATFALALFLELLNRRQGVRTSGNVFVFWILLLICEIPTYRTLIRNPETQPRFRETFIYVLEFIYAPLILVQFFLTCFADEKPKYDVHLQTVGRPSPEKEASFLSRILFFWFESLARKGHRKPLEFSDLWDLSVENSSKILNVKFTKYWEDNLKNNRPLPGTNAIYKKISSSVDVDIKYKPESTETQKIVGIMPVICRAFGSTFLFAAFLKFLQDILVFASPLILSLIITHVQSDEELWKGYFYVILLFAASTLSTLIGNQYFYMMHMIGLRLRTTIVGSIYRKALRMSSASREDSTIGEVVNLMSVDTQKLTELCPYLTILWSAPFQIAISLIFLYQLLGASVFAGLGVMIFLLPVNMIMGIKVKSFQVKQMKNKDKRLNLMSEILSGIKVLKLYAWEPSFAKKVMKIRLEEIKVLKESAYFTAFAMFLWTCAPVVVAIVTFATYVLADESHVLDARKAFVSLSLLNIMRVPFNLLPMMMVSIVQAAVGIKRINKYMNAEEIDKDAVEHSPDERDSIVIEDANFSWKDDMQTLRNINIRIQEGSLVAVVGVVGSGKSSLLSAILGDINRQSGRVNTKGRIAYIAQQAWIQNATVRDNIIFGRSFDEMKYNQVIATCALKPDLEILPAGDKTEIGEKGINLSGGQKQRVSLARATYQSSDIYLLDDPLSAVDSNVGRHIFDNVIGPGGILRKRTRVLVTHGVTFLPQMDNIIVLKDGEISETGTYRELLEKKGAFAEFLIQHLGTAKDEGEDVQIILKDLEQVMPNEVLLTQKSIESNTDDDGNIKNIANGDLNSNQNLRSSTLEREPKKRKENLIEAEEMEIGTIKWGVFWYYIKAIGWPMTIISIIFQLFFQFFAVGSNIWLAVWSNDIPLNDTQIQDGRDIYLSVYGAMGAGQALAIFLATVVMAAGALKASNLLHERLLHRILRAPMAFFDTTPSGRVLNRFAKDVDVCDNAVPMSLSSWIKCLLNVVASFAIICVSTPMFIVVIIPTAILYFLAQRFYVSTSRQLKRLESVSRSPIYSHFTETLTGSSTIRAFGMQSSFISKAEEIVDHNQKCYFPSIVSARFLAVFLEIVGNIVIFFAALFAIIYGDVLSAGVVGLSVSYALQITQALNWMVDTTNNVENNLVAVERLKEYGEVEQEAEWEIEEGKPSESWPDSGEVSFENYQTRYRKELDLVLNDVTCHILPGEKIGIVGRTGAGKSSLALGLFRIIEATGGTIVIDGHDITKMGLHDLRRRITVIPQDPVIFSGTVRSNLDPFLLHSDEAIWRALELAHFKSYVKSLPSGLEYELSEGGDNLSVGQRQLICLARALLRKTKILVLDEATAAVDLETDDLIQATVRQEFTNSTILTIAHRINTIMDYTRIMVLNNGVVQEFDKPSNLLRKKDSLFYAMAKDAGLVQ